MSNEVRKLSQNEERIQQVMDDQGPVSGLINEVFIKKGDAVFLEEWADGNPGPFIKLWATQQPSLAPITQRVGEITIKIESSLGRSALDGPKDIEGEVVQVDG